MSSGAETIAIIAVSGFVAVMVLATIGAIVYLTIRAFRGGGTKKSPKREADETQLIQEIHRGLTKMERRIESLETLVLDDERSKRAKFDRELRND